MKVLFVWPITEFSIWDVAYGYRAALAREIGEHNIRDYFLNKRSIYHRAAEEVNVLPKTTEQEMIIRVAQKASETVLNEALYFDADLVFITSGLNFHPIGLYLLHKVGIHTSVILTESPYEDENQADWASIYPGMTVFTNESTSADLYNWHFLPHAYNPDIHKPTEALEDEKSDVFFCGTGWQERQKLLESIDWTGINLQLRGAWPTMTEESILYPHLRQVVIKNIHLPKYYAGAKICLNFHRAHPTARSLNPRVYEVAACGTFQLSDPRAELNELFGTSIPTFTNAVELKALIDYFLVHDNQRVQLANLARERVARCTFDNKIKSVLRIVEQGFSKSSSPLRLAHSR